MVFEMIFVEADIRLKIAIDRKKGGEAHENNNEP
jgi:hypothetical protein